MSVSKPAMKRTRQTPATQTAAPTASTLTRAETMVDLNAYVEEKNRHTASLPTSGPRETTTPTTMTKTPSHPKGHKVRELAEVWKNMDSQAYLHLTDTLMLADVWVQPISAFPVNSTIAKVRFRQIVDAPHMKFRFADAKMSTDDLLKILYLNDCMQWDIVASQHLPYEEWLNEKSAACVKAKGLDEGSNRAKLCHFIMTEDRDFTFYPTFLKGVGIFFRKICYHSYKTGDKKGEEKLGNPAMIKCCAVNSKFEYVLEARIFTLPTGWFDKEEPTDFEMEVPETQPLL